MGSFVHTEHLPQNIASASAQATGELLLSMEGGERAFIHRWKEKHLEGEISTKCRDNRNSEKDEWKPFHAATEGHWVKLKYSMKYGVRAGCSKLWSELDKSKLMPWL